LILALVLMLSASDVTYELTGVVNNKSGTTLTFKSQNVKPVRVTVTNQILGNFNTGVFYNSNASTTGYEGSVDYATRCDAKHNGMYRLSFHVTLEKNEGSCTYTGDAVCQSRCSVAVSPKSCRDETDCHGQFTYTIGSR
jgi:hypothetical protein